MENRPPALGAFCPVHHPRAHKPGAERTLLPRPQPRGQNSRDRGPEHGNSAIRGSFPSSFFTLRPFISFLTGGARTIRLYIASKQAKQVNKNQANGQGDPEQSGAIAVYILENYDREHVLTFPTMKENALMKQWLQYQLTSQGPLLQLTFYWSIVQPKPDVKAVYVQEFLKG